MNLSRAFWGLVLIGVGVVLLLDQSDVLDAGSILGTWWPLLLIVPAALQIALARQLLIGPLIILAVGVMFLIGELDVLGTDPWQLFWPLLLVAIGAWILFGRERRRGLPAVLHGEKADNADDRVNAFALFGGSDIVSRSGHFEHASLTAIFGGNTLDLRQASVAPEGAVIDATAAFGGVEILVPPGWRVAADGIGILGGFDDKTAGESPAGPESPRLTVRGLALFGGVDIKHKK